MAKTKEARRLRIRRGIRRKISGIESKPRLTVFRSNKEIYAQIVNDVDGKTLVSATSLKKGYKGSKIEQSKQVGLEIGKVAVDNGISVISFDRNGYLYHGRVKALADGAREAGLKF